MPVMDGYTATRRIREMEQFKDLPIIAMTANVMTGDRERSIKAGMTDHVGKPIQIEELFLTMGKWIKPPIPYVSGEPEGDLITPLALPGINVATGLKYCQGNESLYHELLIRFVREYSGIEAQFNEALNAMDYETYTRHAHTLKTVAATIGATKLSEKATSLEVASMEKLPDADLTRLLQDVLEDLAVVVDGLKYLETSFAAVGPDAVDGAPLPQETIECIRHLRTMLDEFDTEALSVAIKLRTMPGVQKHAKATGRIVSALEHYDFDAALNMLEGTGLLAHE